MKSLLISASVAFILLACDKKSDNGISFNFAPKEGQGIIKTQEFVKDFDEIKVAQSISAEVVKSDQEKVVISAPSDIIDDILVENTNGKLYIHFKPNANISARNVAAKIFAKDLFSFCKTANVVTELSNLLFIP